MKDDDVFYQAMLARDHRFDGKFFIGVKTTGIYCRPICPAKPKRSNVEFFLSAHAAELAGHRPCLRCRPESAPLSPLWLGKTAVVQRALRVIAALGYIDTNEDKFAAKFGVTARHLRRLFVDEVGLTPKQIAGNNRLNFARKLLVETRLSMTSIAHTAGFASLRRFNDAFKKRFERSPSELRKDAPAKGSGSIELSLAYRPPFDWTHLLSFFRNHIITGIEAVDEEAYQRVFRLGSTVGHLRVTHDEAKNALKLQVTTTDPSQLYVISQNVRRMFDLDSDPLLIDKTFRVQKVLHTFRRKHPGLRVARGWDPFEMAVVTILGQLVSLKQARQLVAELVENYGDVVKNPVTGESARLFPDAVTLAKSDLLAVRTTAKRRETIRTLAQLVASKQLDLTQPQDALSIREKLIAIPGVGPWTVEYLLMRGLGDTDALPKTDLFLKRLLARYPQIDLEQVRPWRSYLAVHLWQESVT